MYLQLSRKYSLYCRVTALVGLITLQQLHSVVKVARSSGERGLRDGDVEGWGIWHILSITEHFLTLTIPYFHERQARSGISMEQGAQAEPSCPLTLTTGCISEENRH